jgi:hypothetical protein
VGDGLTAAESPRFISDLIRGADALSSFLYPDAMLLQKLSDYSLAIGNCLALLGLFGFGVGSSLEVLGHSRAK